MGKKIFLALCIGLIISSYLQISDADPPQPAKSNYGATISQSNIATIWSCPPEYKVGKHWQPPTEKSETITISLAKNEYEAYQLIVSPKINLSDFTISVSSLQNKDAITTSHNIKILRVGYVNIEKATDGAYPIGYWPDPLFPIEQPLNLKANENHPFWIRVYTPKNIPAGLYKSNITITSDKLNIKIPLQVRVFNFQLPDEMTCKSAFGDRFSEVWKYHHLKSNKDKKIVAEKYLQSFSTHHISPYNCNPVGPSWQLEISVPKNIDSRLFPLGGEYVNNESHTGENSLIITDQNKKQAIYAESSKINLPETGKSNQIKFSLWYRTLLPERMGSVWIRFYDKSDKQVKSWLTNFCGDGHWQKLTRTITKIPSKTDYLKIFLYPAVWTVKGEKTGIVWFDDIQIIANNKKLINPNRGSFETNRKSFTNKEYDKLRNGIKVKFKNGDKWAKAIRSAIDKYHFNTFYLWLKGMGGLSNADINIPKYYNSEGRVYFQNSIEYKIIFEKYIRQLRNVLKKHNLLDKAYVYQYDEPIDSHIPFVKRNYTRLKKIAPELKTLMPTNKINPKLIDIIDYWVIIHNAVDNKNVVNSDAIKWSYICCYPRAPYIGEFIDHPGLDLRLWLWQVFSRKLKGILIWETLYWRADKSKLENPYDNPMSSSAAQGWDWGNGDGRLLYPPPECFKSNKPVIKPPIDSIRWEMIRDGLEDYQYLTILQNLIARSHTNNYVSLLKLPPAITSLRNHTKDPTVIRQLRTKVANAIENLNN